MRSIGVVLALAGFVVAGCSGASHARATGGTPPTAPPTSRQTLSAGLLTDADLQAVLGAGSQVMTFSTGGFTTDPDPRGPCGWFHVEEASTDEGVSSTIREDSGLTGGQQTITEAGGHMEVVLIGTALFLKADSVALTAAFSLSAAEAGQYAERWISMPPSDAGYANVAEGVTVASALNEVALGGPISIGSRTEVDGTAVVGLSGQGLGPNGTAIPETLYVSTAANPLPVEVTEAASDGSILKATFSQWGVPVAIAAPGAAIPIGSIPGAP